MRLPILLTAPCTFLCLCLCLCQEARADTVYKCVEGGRTTYTDRPCPASGKTRTLAVQAAPAPDPDNAARQERARAVLEDLDAERARKATLEERDARDADRRRQQAASDRRRCDNLRLQQKWAEEDAARGAGPARGPEQERARARARRQAEALAAQCPT